MTTPNIPTPRTDAAQKAYEDYCSKIADACRDGKVSLDMAMADFKKEVGECPNDDWETARTLERENVVLREALQSIPSKLLNEMAECGHTVVWQHERQELGKLVREALTPPTTI